MAAEKIKKLRDITSSISVEPVMLLDGLAYSLMVVLVENLQLDKICLVKLDLGEDICQNYSAHKNASDAIQKEYGAFFMYNSIFMCTMSLLFILFMGAWSDKYGRKVPIFLATFAHLLYASGYLLTSWMPSWPVEVLLFVAFVDSLGGGPVSFLTACNSYISDVTSEETRTSRLSLANSIWFLGGPIGTLAGTYIYNHGGYQVLFGTAAVMYAGSLVYQVFFLPECHGPFATSDKLNKIRPAKVSLRMRDSVAAVYGIDKKKVANASHDEQREVISFVKMVKDFFNYQRIVDAFKATLKNREGHIRLYILLLILCNILRKIGRGALMFPFTKKVLLWEVGNYGPWVTYKNLVATLGSLVAVPILSVGLQVSDNVLALVGAVSSILDYVFYGLVTEDTQFFIWLAPISALLVNSCAIAIRATLSKYVNPDELGKVSSVMGAIDGVMPILSSTLYRVVYNNTIEFFPGAQFFFGAGINAMMVFTFFIIIFTDKGKDYDIESPKIRPSKEPVVERTIVLRKDSNWLFDDTYEDKRRLRLATILLSSINFSIEVPLMMLSAPKRLETITEEEEEEENEEQKNGGCQKKREDKNRMGGEQGSRETSSRETGYDNFAYVKGDQ